MMLFVCLMMAGIFGLMLLLQLSQAGILPAFGHAKSKTVSPAAKAATQASQSAPQEK